MSYNGSGVYTLPGAALVNGEIVSATENNQFRNDVASALNTAWTRDGQSPATGNIPMASHKFTGLAAGAANGDSVRYEQLPSSTNPVPVNAGGTGSTTGATALVALGNRTGATGSEILPAGTTAQRDGSPAAGYIRFNSDNVKFEGYNGSTWTAVGGGATGGGSDAVFIENGQAVTTNYTLTANNNAGSFGPITINSGVTVTVPSGQVWTVV